ncbi:mannose-6-phosphate receptor binding domain-containing protein [Podospora aff. communis PSN243]|uniref:Mannose-6-phosphate receptor binding domain-containing protein n=1 Tax=Podospora aff. communis PSN243 TaxID=3040156 RepID=A0AAV9GK00_9PEZI|nr:mannose-6-phosphate receptor binding domain-containing protein [Podospora aff. communis PSN243]
MHPRFFLPLAAMAGAAYAGDKESTKTTSTTTSTATACVATATNGAFFDLRPDTAIRAEEGVKTPKGARIEDYVARGYDYGANFTLNICGAVVKKVDDVVGVEKPLWKNISAFYEHKGDVYSLGLQSGELVPRGKKLVLQYSGGSPCGKSKGKDEVKRGNVHNGASYRGYSDDDDEEKPRKKEAKDKDDDQKKPSKDKDDKEKEKEKDKRRKSATISFLCDRDPDVVTSASFVGTDPDECAYFFEVRSQHACAGAEPHKPGSVGPGSVFAIIFFIAILVYVVGGIFYQRTVAHARGWRQLPNYSLWSGIWNFLTDIAIILTSSCARFLPSRRGYHSLSVSANGRNRNRDDENRLIDQLDEEWDD